MNDERPPCPKCHAPYHLEGAERYWEARWRDERVENDQLRKVLEEINADVRPELCSSELELIVWWGRQVDRLQAIARAALQVRSEEQP